MTEEVAAVPPFQTGPSPDCDPGRPKPLDWDVYVQQVCTEWKQLLAGSPGEKPVQDFLELHPSMIPGGHGDVGAGGNHGSEMFAVFTKPELKGEGPSYIPDFMWITRSSALVTPILVEIEDPDKPWFTTRGRLTSQFHEAHGQLLDWRTWFETGSNKEVFRRRFLFEDDYDGRPLKPYYVLVFGRQSHFTSQKHFLVREQARRDDEVFTTFDSLAPHRKQRISITIKMTAGGEPRPWAFSAGYETGSFVGDDALRLGDPSEALARSRMISPERKKYLAERWEYWRKVELQRDKRQGAYARIMGLE